MIVNLFEKVDFPDLSIKDLVLEKSACPFCHSQKIQFLGGIYPELDFACSECEKGNHLDLYDIFNAKEYIGECPECDAEDVVNGVCFTCGYELEADRDYEQERNLQYLMSKND